MTDTDQESISKSFLISNRIPPPISIALVGGGILLLAWVAWSVFTGDGPEGPPYSYSLVSEGSVEQFGDLGLTDVEGLMIQKYEVRVRDMEKPLADFHIGNSSTESLVLLDWHNQLSEPLLTMRSNIQELNTLVEAVTDHLPEQAVMLAWWDIARALKLLAGVNSPFNENLALPIFTPELWNNQKEEITALEHRFWKVPAEANSSILFEKFVDALSADENTGAAELKALTATEDGYLVVHLTDAYRLGAMRPDRFGIGYKDFPKTTELHGLIERVKDWLKEQDYDPYLITHVSDTTIRVFFLTDEASTNTLMAKLLPFSTSNPVLLDSLQLVAQYAGYWVYKLQPSDAGDTEKDRS